MPIAPRGFSWSAMSAYCRSMIQDSIEQSVALQYRADDHSSFSIGQHPDAVLLHHPQRGLKVIALLL